MKKILMTICIVTLIALIGVVAVACDDTPVVDDNPPNTYEQATYTVTFNTNGDVVLTDNVLKVKAGEKISAPKVNGEVFTPVKKGYTFQYWSADGTKEWNFDSDTVNKNITLTAVYTNNVYYHTVNIQAKLEYGKDSDGNPTYSIDEDGYSLDNVSLPAAELNQDTTTLKSTYNGTLSALAVPTVLGDDCFCFWYYLDNDGKPVQFTKWAESGDKSVAMLAKYYFTSGLTLYPMYRSNLPKIDVIYRDSATEAVYDSTHAYTIGDEIPLVDKIANPQRAGYLFKEWYYVIVDEDEVEHEINFVFSEEKVEGTDLMSAAGVKGYFVGGELRLYARWQKLISIASKQDYLDLYDALHVKEPNDNEKAIINEILGAQIQLASIDFGGATIRPLFDENTLFTGSIDGGTYDTNGTLTSSCVWKNAVLSGDSHASFFGYIAGSVKNIDVEGVTFALSNDTKLTGVIASQNFGEIANVNVNLGAITLDAHALTFGGIVGENNGSNNAVGKGYITNAHVTISSVGGNFESITFGGIAGKTNSSSRLVSVSANVHITSFIASDDNISANGLSSMTVGGLVATNGGTISLSSATIKVDALSSVSSTNFGGVSAVNTGTLSRVSADVTLASSSAPALIGASTSQVAGIGGIAGKNEGVIITSYANAQLYARMINSNSIVTIGGIVGNNYSDRRDSQSSQIQGVGVINSCYVVGEIVLDKQEGVTGAVVYAASLAGRNSQSKLAKNFAIVNVSVTNDGTNNVGYLFGSMEKRSTMVSGWYAKESTFTLNGNAFSEDSIIKIGTPTDKANFTSKEWLEHKDNVAFDSAVWDIVDGSLPTIR